MSAVGMPAAAGSDDEQFEAGLEALFSQMEQPGEAPTALDASTAAGTALDSATGALPAATALDPATAAATGVAGEDGLDGLFSPSQMEQPGEAPTALDASTAAATALDSATAAATGFAGEDGFESEGEGEGMDFEAELMKEVEAALFSGSEDDMPASSLHATISQGGLLESPVKPAAKAAKAPKQAGAATASTSSSSPAAKAPPKQAPTPVDPNDNGFDESRYMKDQNGELLHKWKVDYAARAGGGRAMCKDTDCLERHEQGGVKLIEKGALRIGRRVLMKGHGDDEGRVHIMWYHARCMFNVFLRSRKVTRVIQSPEDLEGFEHIHADDQDMLRKFIHSNDEIRGWKGGQVLRPGAGGAAGAGGKRGLETPEKTPGAGREPGAGLGGVGLLGESKRRKVEQSKVALRKGDRVWTFCRVRPPPSADGRMPNEFAVRSAKAELGMIFDEEKDGHVIVQFEKTEHEKERLDLYSMPKKKNIKGWLRYPRVFEGKKQRIPCGWIDFKRPPPRLCGCVRQEWGHNCDCSGIACSRGSSTKVWGVGQ